MLFCETVPKRCRSCRTMSNLPRFLRMKASVKKAETQDADSASTVLTTTRCCWIAGASAPLNEGQNIQRNSVPICGLGEYNL